MSDAKKSIVRARDAQLSIRLDSQLYEEYKELLRSEDTTMTEDIEIYIRSRLGKDNVGKNVVNIFQLAQDVEELKRQMGKLKVS